jgi:hypothetical protein
MIVWSAPSPRKAIGVALYAISAEDARGYFEHPDTVR